MPTTTEKPPGSGPPKTTGPVIGLLGETWLGVDAALRDGRRGLPGGSSLAQLLNEKRNARNVQQLPPLTPETILTWADAHHQRTGDWPSADSGIIPNSGGETWRAVATALRAGVRGLPGGSSLAQLLAERRGVRNRKALPPLTEEDILRWADAHHARHGVWPRGQSGSIDDAPGETWTAVAVALTQGRRGLPGGSSLARLLAEKRGVRNAQAVPPLSLDTILAWADAHHQRTGEWPRCTSGPVAEAPGKRGWPSTMP